VAELIAYDSELGWDIMYADPESDQLAYDAQEVWCVSEWLAGKLRKHSARVQKVGSEHYWARRNTGPAVFLDSVIQKIVRE